MDDFDLNCLPIDFVGTSRPSERLNAFYAKRENAEKKVIQELRIKQQEICEKYEKILVEQSNELKQKLDEVRECIKNELRESKVKSNYDNAYIVKKSEFKIIYNQIRDYTQKQYDLIENFYSNLVKMERDKSNEFTFVLTGTYENIKQISYKLPSQYDEWIEVEIEKLNQTILCNHSNYAELKTQLQKEILNESKNTIQELQYVKECWVKFLKTQSEKDRGSLRDQYTPEFLNILKQLGEKTEQLNANLNHVDLVKEIEDANEYLNNLRQTLGILDQKAQKLMINYKQASVMIFNRIFEELKTIEDTVEEIANSEPLPLSQIEMYTPNLQEIYQIYDVELEIIQKIWTDLVAELTKTTDNTFSFLAACTSLWQKHFRRTELLQVIMLKDLENTIKLHNTLSEPYETKLNVLIDTLRQDPSKDKMRKTMEDITKLMNSMEALYRSQNQVEAGVMRKYKSTQELQVDVLLAEVKRFLTVYPPDREMDPKIQRKRASWTSDIDDPTDGLIPNQMLYCKFQVGAVSNWQFGLWECISNYVALARAEITAETEKWMQDHTADLDRRLQIRLGIHALRMEKIEIYIYEERLNELCLHQLRFEEHKQAVELRIAMLKNNYQTYQDQCSTIVEEYLNAASEMESTSKHSENSYTVVAFLSILQGKLEKCIEEIERLYSEYLDKCHKFEERVKASHVLFSENMQLFSETGNFSFVEIKDFLKSMDKLQAQVEKAVLGIENDLTINKVTTIEKIHAKNAEVNSTLNIVLEEHRFVESLIKSQKTLQKELLRHVCAHQLKFKRVTDQYELSKMAFTANIGDYDYFKDFAIAVNSMIHELTDMAKKFEEAVPVRFFSDKSHIEKAPKPTVSSTKILKTFDDQIHHITTTLFNFQIRQDDVTYFMELSTILRKCWDDTVEDAKRFYKKRNDCFFLGQEKIHPSLLELVEDLYKKILQMENQCETKLMEDIQEYLCFSWKYIEFLQDYVDMYFHEYARKSRKHFEDFFESEIRQAKQNYTTDIKKQYAALQKKLKPIYGHPRNKKHLENMQIEAEIIHSEATELLSDVKPVFFNKLEDEYNKTVNDYYELKNLMHEVIEVAQRFTFEVQNLQRKLNEKVNHLEKMINYYSAIEGSQITKDVILSHCKSFLTLHCPIQVTLNSMEEYAEPPPIIQCQNDPMSKEFSEFYQVNSSSLQNDIEQEVSTKSLALESEDNIFLTELKEYYVKCYAEIDSDNIENILQVLKIEWSCAVTRVVELYAVKYDQYRA